MMMKNHDQSVVKINHNPNCPYIPVHPYRILIITDFDKKSISRCCQNLYASITHSNQLVNCLSTKIGIKEQKKSKAFIDYSQKINDIYTNLEDCNPRNERKISRVFDDMIADIEANEKLSPTVTELFSTRIKLII